MPVDWSQSTLVESGSDLEAYSTVGDVMKITVPDDCGNSPRNLLVSQFSVDWAAGKIEHLRPLLADDVQWNVMGEPELDAESGLALPQDVRAVGVFTAINHGRASSCNGRMLTDAGWTDFCHVFRFSGVAKSAKIVHVRTYLVRV